MKIENTDIHARQSDDQTGLATRSRLSWSDFQIVMVVARIGQLAKATEVLAMSHATLLRKLASIETRLKARLFDRVRGHYIPTVAGDELIRAAQSMAPLARQAEMRVVGQDIRPSGHVRITAPGVIVSHLLPPVLEQFASAYPEVMLEFSATLSHVSLARREADVALRMSDEISAWLVGRKLASLDFRIYDLHRQDTKQRIQPVNQLVRQKRWISFERDARDLKFERWLTEQVPDSSVVMRVDGFDHALAMLRAGLGIALLPTFLENTFPELHALSLPIPELRTPLWMITHKDLRDTMRIKVLMQTVGPALVRAVQGGATG